MSAIQRVSSKVTFHSISPICSPGGGEPGTPTAKPMPGLDSNKEPVFKDDDRCPSCGALILSDAHRLFIFYRSPADIQHAPVMGGTPAEWRPSAEETPIPGDRGPNRVAYWHNGAATVQVHEGDDDGMWVPCSSYTVTRDGLPYTMWMCRRDHVSNPCDAEYLRSISS